MMIQICMDMMMILQLNPWATHQTMSIMDTIMMTIMMILGMVLTITTTTILICTTILQIRSGMRLMLQSSENLK